jgi:hypothetical protein
MINTTKPRITIRMRDLRAPADVAMKCTFLLYWLRPPMKILSKKMYPPRIKMIVSRAVAYLATLGESGTASKKTFRPPPIRQRINGASKALTIRSSSAILDFPAFSLRYLMEMGIRENTSPSQMIRAPDGIPHVLRRSMAFSLLSVHFVNIIQ